MLPAVEVPSSSPQARQQRHEVHTTARIANGLLRFFDVSRSQRAWNVAQVWLALPASIVIVLSDLDITRVSKRSKLVAAMLLSTHLHSLHMLATLVQHFA